MGISRNISYSKWPAQGDELHQRVRVCFQYDGSRCMDGVVVRADKELPYRMIIRLDDGRFVLATECMYSLEGK